ncbi:MAG: Cas10/Cmr2 second palm domain-containing protein, partial [Bryobacteraceae bacterium]
VGRCAWLTLLCEVLPRALLAELKLSRMLLGSSSAEQFLLVLAEEDISRANEFLAREASAISQLSSGGLRLVWASTENLGAWPLVRKRLDDALAARNCAPLAEAGDSHEIFKPFTLERAASRDCYFESFARNLPLASRVGWSKERPGKLAWDDGEHSWTLTEQSTLDDDAILFPRRFALSETSSHPASLTEVAGRAEGAAKWGILCGDVDHFDPQLRQVNSIEEHIHLSVLFKEFFAGELAVLCTLPDFWRKVSILYRGGDDFAVMGAWDALVLLARELERLFERFVEQNAGSFPGLASRTISMALAIAPDSSTPASAVFQEASAQLRNAKASEVGAFQLFGRTLEWKRLSDAEELKLALVRLVRDFGYSPNYIHDLTAVYREASSIRTLRRGKTVRIDKPWRTYRRLSTVIPQERGREVNNVRNAVIVNLIGKRTAGLKLRPSGRVGLEWARLAASRD